MKHLLLAFLQLILMLTFTVSVSAQNNKSERLRPKWMQKVPTPQNSTYIYKVVRSTASDLNEARKRNISSLLIDADFNNGVVVLSNRSSNQKVEQRWENGKQVENISYTSDTDTQIKSEAMRLYVEDITEYWTRSNDGTYHLYKLYARSRINEIPQFDDVTITQRYGARGLWRSAIVPGWGQFYKGDNLKGGLLLGGCAVAAAGLIFTESERADYDKKIGQTSNTQLKKDYINKRNNFETARNICIGVAAAIYVYNLIDAVTASGATRVETKSHNSPKFVVAPTITNDGAAGFTAALTF